ncbi:energy-coupling factor transporter transmembrane protein EcfT [Deferribacterales bacterium Es71-Z0220]|jgi:energy-coupling factor transport system permease protein|uniref:energy-coupling factor transporter transmembrane component T family protein n=1 Tax=Deferrivibrio essentukiensis TaxID=2880922 RepID=UPI001F60B239|nr:energy-coupling factor transporter transmembrane component T [Deferrivibrio essentukiensis]MBZ4642631.1 ABC-type transporter, integral rane subunit [Deferribacteraceae bacterium]MBZ4672400.1 ABC-type transporter, integral rane subunit [Deferribacteraceae bacterium]MCB4203876.1 energy-coupling factor transporter transmembrane protein EcfT [Deferrivibrio essentukiensis]
MNKVVIGKYIHRNSFIHRLNPITKFLSTIVFLIFIGLKFDLLSFIFYTIIAVAITLLSRIKPMEILTLLKPFRYLLIFTFAIQLFYDNNNGLNYIAAFLYTCKFSLMIIISSLFTITTKPIDIVKIVYIILKPFKVFGVNPTEMATSCIIAIRFIPLIFEEADKIITAQKLRGIIPKKGLRLLFSLHTFLIPLFNRVFYYAEQISITLNYRTNWEHILTIDKMRKLDILLITSIIAGCYGISIL